MSLLRTKIQQYMLIALMLFISAEVISVFVDYFPETTIEFVDLGENTSEPESKEEKKKEDYFDNSDGHLFSAKTNRVNNKGLLHCFSEVCLTVQTPPPNLS